MLTNKNYTSINTTNLEEKARLLTKLSGAAHYFDIPKLEGDVQTQLNELMHTLPSLACAILDESSSIPSGEGLCIIAMSYIRARPKASLLHWNYYHNCNGVSNDNSASYLLSSSYSSMKSSSYIDNNSELQPSKNEEDIENNNNSNGGVISLNASLLEQVIFDEQSTANELTKFLCLQSWVNGCKHDVSASAYEGFIGDIIDLPRKQRGDDTDDVNDNEMDKTISAITASTAASTSASVVAAAAAVLPISSSMEDQYEQRLLIAKHLSQKLDLSLIPASDLSTTITESNLISTHDLYQAYRLQALNAERTKSKVFVEGAGLPEVNGTYLQRGVHEGTPMYNKEGVWLDREEIFRIFLCTYSNGNKSWCLSIVPKGREPGKTTDIDFYECPVSYGKAGPAMPYGGGTGSENQGNGLVPSRGWKLVNYGQPPVPKCSLIVGCLEDA